MSVYLVTLVTVGCVSFPAFRATGSIGCYKFGDPGKRLSERWNFVAESDQEIARLCDIAAVTNRHGRARIAAGQFVRYETAIAERPQQLIEVLCVFARHRVNVNGVLQPPGFLSQLAGKCVSCVFVDPVENVKIDLSHALSGQGARARQHEFRKQGNGSP